MECLFKTVLQSRMRLQSSILLGFGWMSHGHSFFLHAAAFACPSDVLFGSVMLMQSEHFSYS